MLIAGLLLVTVGDATPRSDDLEAVPPIYGAAVATLGPTPGTSVATYLTNASFKLRHFGEVGASKPTFAVVDLASFQSPAQVQEVFRAIEVVRVYVKVHAGNLPTLVRGVPLTSITELDTGLSTAATVARSTAKSYGVLLHGLHPRTTADRTVKFRYAQQRRAALREAAVLSAPRNCGCVFAVIVRGTFLQLSAIARDGFVRAVDPAPAEVQLSGLTVLPLLPDVTRLVPRTGLPGG